MTVRERGVQRRRRFQGQIHRGGVRQTELLISENVQWRLGQVRSGRSDGSDGFISGNPNFCVSKIGKAILDSSETQNHKNSKNAAQKIQKNRILSLKKCPSILDLQTQFGANHPVWIRFGESFWIPYGAFHSHGENPKRA